MNKSLIAHLALKIDGRWLAAAALVACAACGGDAGTYQGATGAADAGGAEPADQGCGLSFDDAIDAYAPERVCQTTIYDRVTGYCTHWVACSDL